MPYSGFTTIDAPAAGATGTTLLGINATGQIVGGSNYSFTYDSGTFTPFSSPSAPAGGLTGINDLGQVVGIYSSGSGTHAFLDVGGTITTLDDPDATVTSPGGTPTTTTEAYGINNAGQIGGIYFHIGHFESFLYSAGSFTTFADPSTYFNDGPAGAGFNGGGTILTGINNTGQMVGYYFDFSGATYGFVDDNGTFTTIADPLAFSGANSGTIAFGINNSGDVVGAYYDSGNVRHGFIDHAGTFTTIDFPGAVSTIVTGINATGTIVGQYIDASNVGHGFTAIACFVRGTTILTVRGQVAVEDLAVGDSVLTHFGKARPIRWIGQRRIDLSRHADPQCVQPIRILTGAFAEAIPHRDLLVSPDHALLIGGVLIPAKLLVNGASIVTETQFTSVDYYHVELGDHDILLAEGMPAESYLDSGNRSMFANGGQPLQLHPDFAADQRRETLSCAPFVTDAALVESVWLGLMKRARSLGWSRLEPEATDDDPDLHVLAGARRIDPLFNENGHCVFAIPANHGPLWLHSRTARPSEAAPWVDDQRILGVAIQRLIYRRGEDVRELAIDDPSLDRGWWQVEQDATGWRRWTDGNASLPSLGPGILEVRLARINALCLSA